MSRPARCEACGTELIWATSTKNGKASPIVKAPNREQGNVLLYRTPADTPGPPMLMADALPRELAEALRERGVPLRLNHFADCPERERFRGR